MATRSNQARGEAHHAARLTEAQVRELCERYAAGATEPVLAAAYGIDTTTVNRVVTGATWKHLDRPITRRGRPRGERHPAARLTEAEVGEIRRAWTAGEATQYQLAARHGVSQPRICRIVRGLAWARVP